MKRTRFILLVVVVAMVLMGAGYAAWTQVFNIQGTVSSGKLSVEVTNTTNFYDVVDSENRSVIDGPKTFEASVSGDYLSAAISSSEDELRFQFDNIYPGTKVGSSFSLENNGTLAALLTLGEVGSISSNPLWSDLKVTIEVDGNEVVVKDMGDSSISQDAFQAIAEDVRRLEPSEATKTITITQELPYSSENVTQGQGLEWTLPLVFEQYN